MGARDRLLREPPSEFLDLGRWLHQDFGFEVTPERGIEGYLADHVSRSAAGPIMAYIEALLGRDDIDNGDLKGLVKRSWDLPFQADGARQLLAALHDNLKSRAG